MRVEEGNVGPKEIILGDAEEYEPTGRVTLSSRPCIFAVRNQDSSKNEGFIYAIIDKAEGV